ncbi:hypothetical protein D1B31_22080 [Neobacillus notoginsengisoli]|uniref:Uncharacterized protein n=1 Tax=Neobacillus notoginsengisoli TaxID=1578198 RepID=A0A417YFM0_9BACI|nr:hypothetical protein [Neobacillus notoginsengisoli]RHW31497.1 hypothetical protein D1B31_22080 [Neobacillus notoginsengisoli]
MKYKYFVLNVTFRDDETEEYYLKGKSMEYMEERIRCYSEGGISTSRWTIATKNAVSCFLREVDPAAVEFPELSKRDFVSINEHRSF